MNHRPVVFTEEQAAEMLACDVDTLRTRAGRGDIVGLKVGRGWVFPAAAFEESINRLAVEQAQAAGRRREPPAPAATTVQKIVRRPPPLPDLRAIRGGQPDPRP
jgi:hypothetical protein